MRYYDDPPRCYLTPQEICMAAFAAHERRMSAVRHRLMDAAGLVADDEAKWYRDFDGAAAEILFARLIGGKWVADVDSFKKPDVLGPDGTEWQVRQTDLENGCLIVRKNDNPEHSYALLVGTVETGFNLVGWRDGASARKDRWWHEANGRPPAWWVPQHCLEKIVIEPSFSSNAF